MRRALVIMSRVPKPGRTKTRLMNKLTGQECVKIHTACLEEICEAASELELERYIYYTGGRPGDFDGVDLSGFTMRRQTGKDLGQRLSNAAQKILTIHDRLLFIGADVPGVTSGLLLEAFGKLSEYDVVIGPALDGGYYLVGMKQHHDEIFQSIPWGTGEVYESTIHALKCNGLSHFALGTRQDIDTWEDIINYYNRSVNKSIQTRTVKAIAEVLQRFYPDREGTS